MTNKTMLSVVLTSLLAVFAISCSNNSGGSSGGNGGGTTTGSSNVSGAQSYFLATSGTAARASNSINANGVLRDDDRNGKYDIDDDIDGSILYFIDSENLSKEVIFTIDGVQKRAFVDDVIYAGNDWLLAEVDSYINYPTPRTNASASSPDMDRDGDDRDDNDQKELLFLINSGTGDIKQMPDMRGCGDDGEMDIEQFEVIGDTGYAICEDAAYSVNMATLASTQIGQTGKDAYDDAAAAIFPGGIILATTGTTNNTESSRNSSSLVNTNAKLNYDTDLGVYEFSKLEAGGTFHNVIVAGAQGQTLSEDAWKSMLRNAEIMKDYYHTQMKFLFGDARYERDDGKNELELTDSYSRANGVNYKFGNFKDRDSKIYTLSLDDNHTAANVSASTVTSVALAEISVDANGKITRNVIEGTPIEDGLAANFSGVLWNRKDTTSRYLDIQRAFDDKAFYAVDMVATPKTVTRTPWTITLPNFGALKSATTQPKNKGIYYGEAGIAFGNANSTITFVEYKTVDPVQTVNVSCAKPNDISLNGKDLFYKCNGQTFVQDLNDLTAPATPVSAKGKTIGNIIEVKNKKNGR